MKEHFETIDEAVRVTRNIVELVAPLQFSVSHDGQLVRVMHGVKCIKIDPYGMLAMWDRRDLILRAISKLKTAW